MIRYVYSFRHEDANYFLKPDVTDQTPDNALIGLRRDCIKNADTYVRNGLQNCSFWILGTFDDEKGEFEYKDKRCLATRDDIIGLVKKGLGGFIDGTNPGNEKN